jgi:hypothetical protein
MKRTPGRTARAIAAIMLTAFALGACSSAAAPNDLSREAMQSGPTIATPAMVPPEPGMAGGSTGEVAGSAATAGPATSDGQKIVDYASSAANDLLVIKTGNLILQVDDIGASLTRAYGVITGLGGYVSGSDESNEGEKHVAVITYRIPAARWDDALQGLRGLATKVIGEKTNAVEVTGQVQDLGARITNLQASEQALQAIMTRATKISDILEVQSQLTDVRGTIEQLQTEMQHLQDQAAYGTLAVNYETPVVAVEQAKQGWNLGDEVDRAAAQLVSLAQGLASSLVWLAIVVLPLLLVAVIILIIIFVPLAFVLRRISRRMVRTQAPMWNAATPAPAWGAAPFIGGPVSGASAVDAAPVEPRPDAPGAGPSVAERGEGSTPSEEPRS